MFSDIYVYFSISHINHINHLTAMRLSYMLEAFTEWRTQERRGRHMHSFENV